MQFEENHVLFGADPAARIVSVELAGENEVHVYRRPAGGAATGGPTGGGETGSVTRGSCCRGRGRGGGAARAAG